MGQNCFGHCSAPPPFMVFDYPSGPGRNACCFPVSFSVTRSLLLDFLHFNNRLYRITVILTVLRQVLLGLGNDVASRDSLFTSIADTFQEFVVEYAELMTEDDERLGDLKKILRYLQFKIQNEARALMNS